MAKKGEMRISVWQFVRIMVALEGRRPRPSVYAAWEGAWRELDTELTKLGRTDHAAYSDLMMNQEVVLELGSDKHRGEVIAVLRRITQDMKRQLRVASGGAADRRSLKFELAELGELNRSLNRDSPSPRQSG
ncbi:MAG: hypothetical protein O3B21_14460 [Proteobacteria bacterium]|nr:hypothetical protein [Pseudomonadota bacterium]MDA1357264.1 hypothetical protein [Pseudomonadota bacterium]